MRSVYRFVMKFSRMTAAVTLASALALRQRQQLYSLPKERPVMSAEASIVVCPTCGRKNLVQVAASGSPRCGNCHNPLPWPDDGERPGPP